MARGGSKVLTSLDELGITMNRNPKVTLYQFTDYFQGFERVEAIKALFREKTEEVLKNLKVEFYSSKFGYMGVSDEDGHLLVSAHHLRTADPIVLYLDIVHELHHVRQFFDGRELFSPEFEYVDSPVEIEAYKATVVEAKRIGMPEEQVIDYLKIEWLTDEQHARLVRAVGLSK